jgi:hypothetical protein
MAQRLLSRLGSQGRLDMVVLRNPGWLFVTWLAACGFTAPVSTVGLDASTVDGTEPATDAPHPEVAACRVAVGAAITDRGRVGYDGGDPNLPALECPHPLERIVGIALLMSDQDTLYDGRSAQGIRIACAPVTVDGDAAGSVGAITEHEIQGTGGFDWFPSTWTPRVACQPGWVLSGLRAHRGGNDNRFLDVSITCKQLGPDASSIATESIHVSGSFTDPVNPNEVQCAADEVVARLPNRTGSGLDSVNLECAPARCSD